MKLAVLIPAFRPGKPLAELVARLAQTPMGPIIVVDDGSGPQYHQLFRQLQQYPQVQVLQHAVNLGKGAALKTGINHALCSIPDCDGVVTADADGQHHPEDILKVAGRLAEAPECLVLGMRKFGPQVPVRSRLGNTLTRGLVRLLTGQRLWDTQTGLRGIPAALLPELLKIGSSGYEFELDMLIAAKHHGCRILQEEVRTIYGDGAGSSHFNPLLDSMRIYFVLLRFSMVSLLTAILDNLVFYVAYQWTASVLEAQVVGRAAAVLFNYNAARRAVFLSDERHRRLLPKYLLLVLTSGAVSYSLIGLLRSALPVGVIWAKLMAETALFLANFVIQRDLVFTKRQSPGATTDWDQYYAATPLTARISRRYTAAVLLSALKRFCGAREQGPSRVIELGGANSCFVEAILAALEPREYHVVDSNAYGLELLRQRLGGRGDVVLHQQDVLDLKLEIEADVVFSVGLIEHFDAAGTRRALLAHFDLLKPGGCAIVSFPTPSLLYRAARRLCELLGLWKFPDERPVARSEVLECIAGRGRVVFEKILWPIMFTQRLMVIRKLAHD
jgi:glycosyltransferase involved in cell wall biosynthesis/SAM-dependent methyltransferase